MLTDPATAPPVSCRSTRQHPPTADNSEILGAVFKDERTLQTSTGNTGACGGQQPTTLQPAPSYTYEYEAVIYRKMTIFWNPTNSAAWAKHAQHSVLCCNSAHPIPKHRDAACRPPRTHVQLQTLAEEPLQAIMGPKTVI